MYGLISAEPLLGRFFVPRIARISFSQAAAVWNWSNFLHAHVPVGKVPLRVNMDETAVKFCPTMKEGCLTMVARLQKRLPKSLSMDVTRSQMRGSMTLICFVCDDETIQPCLPQILLVNKRHAPNHMLPSIRACVRPPVLVWFVDKAWMTASLMKDVLCQLDLALEPWSTSHQVILSADAFRAHLSHHVWRATAALNMFYLVIPAKMTWALQPCDTHVFAKFKHHFAIHVQVHLVASSSAQTTLRLVVLALMHALEHVVVHGRFLKAFQEVGLTGDQTRLSNSMLQKIGLHARPSAVTGFPTLSALQSCFPTGVLLPVDDMFRVLVRRVPRAPPRPHEREVVASRVAVPAGPHPWLGRLRSSSALGSQEEPLPAAAPPCPQPPPPMALPAAPPTLDLRPQFPRARRLLPWRRPLPPDSPRRT